MALAPASVTPSNATVAAAWARSLGLPAGEHLPAEVKDWETTGFVDTHLVVGGFPEKNVPIRRPVIQFSCYAARRPQSKKPNWGLANSLASRLVDAVYAEELPTIELPAYLRPVYIAYLAVLLEPREAPETVTDLARIDVDIQIGWITREVPA